MFIKEIRNVFGRQINKTVDRVILLTEVMVVERKSTLGRLRTVMGRDKLDLVMPLMLFVLALFSALSFFPFSTTSER